MPNPKGGINAEAVNPNEAHQRAQFRRQDMLKDRDDPQVGPLENRRRTANRSTRTGS